MTFHTLSEYIIHASDSKKESENDKPKLDKKYSRNMIISTAIIYLQS